MHKLSTAVTSLLIVFFLSSVASAQFVSTRGKQIVTPDGRPLALKGINLGNWLLPEGYMFKFKTASSPRLIQTVINELVGEDEARKFWKSHRDRYVTKEDIHFIKQSGFNSIRVPFSYRLFVSAEDPRKLEGEGYEILDRVVSWCKDENLYVILDMHAAPGGQTGDNIDDSWGYPFLLESPESQELTVRIWQKLATRYSNEPTVLGYDLLNEPISTNFDAEYFNPKLEPIYKRIVAAIRAVDANHIIFLGGAQWNNNFKVFGPPFDSKLVYTFHKYWMELNMSVIQEYVDFGNKYKVPLWMGESGENTDEWVAGYRNLLEKNDIGWCFWPYKKIDATSSPVSINKPAEWDTIVAYAEKPRTTFDEIRKSRPDKERVQRALESYLENIKFKNCRINPGYLKALGLNPGT